MTRLKLAWHALLTDAGPASPSVHLHEVEGPQSLTSELLSVDAQTEEVAPTYGETPTATSLRPQVDLGFLPIYVPMVTPFIGEVDQCQSACERLICDQATSVFDDNVLNRFEPSPSSEQLDAEPSTKPETHVDELAAIREILQLQVNQLHGVNKDVEDSVAGVCSGFHGIAERAQAAVASARSANISESAASGTVSPLEEMHQVLESLLVAVQSSCSFSKSAAEQLCQLERRLVGIDKVVSEVEDIAGRAKMVALNGRIEASRLGERGKAFAVVAQETKDLADKAGKTSCTIRESINELAVELFDTTAEMRQRAKTDAENVEKTNAAVRQLLTRLEQTYCQMNMAMTATANISVELRSDIGKAVTSMQFQDRVSQRVAHVVEALTGLADLIHPWCSEASATEAKRHFDSWQSEMAQHYTMDSERTANGASPQCGSTGKSDNTLNVELF